MGAVLLFVERRVLDVIRECDPLGAVRSIAPGSQIEALGFDSMHMIGLAVRLEERFRVPIPDEIAEAVTVADVICLVERSIELQQAAAARPAPAEMGGQLSCNPVTC